MGDKIVLTYETLFELLRREKSRPELQEMDKDFFQQVASYLQEKQAVAQKKSSVFGEDEAVRTERQIENVRKILKELFERREKKVIELALNKSKTQSELIPMNFLLNEERDYFIELLRIMDSARKGILRPMLDMRLPCFEVQKIAVEDAPEIQPYTLLRLTYAVPKFLGTDLTVYGPFLENDMAYIPQGLAKVLVNKKRAEAVSASLA